MLLQRTGSRTVVGTDFEVEECFPSHLLYREGSREIRVSAELSRAAGASILLFYDDHLRTHDQPTAEHNERTVLVRINAALLLLGINADWQALPPSSDRCDWSEIMAAARSLVI